VVIAERPQVRHLRPRGGGVTQPTTTVELFFDLVYVFAIMQLSHLILDDLSVGGVARAVNGICAIASGSPTPITARPVGLRTRAISANTSPRSSTK
jgi:hypothetical protein